MALGQIGQVPNRTIFQGIVKRAQISGITTSTWDARTGGQSKSHFEGSQAQITALAQEAQTAGLAYNIIGGAVWQMDVTFPVDIIVNSFNNEPAPVTFWELSYTTIDRSVLECNERPFVAPLAQLTKVQIERDLKALNINANHTSPADGANLINATVAFNLMLMGSGGIGKAAFIPTLKRTAIVSNDFDLQNLAGWGGSQIYNGTVMNTDQLYSQYNKGNPLGFIPDYINFQLPQYIPAYDVSTNSITPRRGFVMSKDGIVSYIGWLQYPIESQQISINKIQTQQSFVFNNWSAGNFGLYSAAFDGAGPNPGPVIIGTQKLNAVLGGG